jgi:FdhD protein
MHEAAERTLADGSKDRLIREEALMLRIAGEPLLTMRTPGADLQLATGFMLSEGIAKSLSEFTVSRTAGEDDDLAVELPSAVLPRVKARLARTHEVRASCGICGLRDAEHLLEDLPPLLPGVPKLDRERIGDLARRFVALQHAFAETGACHGAALFSATGDVLGFGEDVGRHNALDKAIGAAAEARAPLDRAIALLSGRAGFDLVLKCLRVRVPVILSVSAPSALGFDLCERAGATLVGFVRGDRAKVYCDGGRIVPARV